MSGSDHSGMVLFELLLVRMSLSHQNIFTQLL